jgi:hypothetical protein
MAMRYFLCCLPLVIALGCALAPDIVPVSARLPDELLLTSAPEPRDDTKKPIDSAGMAKLAGEDPVAFIRNVIRRYDREVKGYRVTLDKQERVRGKLLPKEVVRAAFREQPFSVLMEWTEGAREASKTLWVEGENDKMMLVLPHGWLNLAPVVRRDPTGAQAMAASRYPITEFGIQIGTRRTAAAWEKARKRGHLKILFHGEKRLKELGDRPAWELQRVGYPKAEVDGITGETFYYDTKTWLQVGSVLKGKDDKLIASYYFRDLELNPDFPAATFTRASLTRKPAKGK